MATGVLGRNDLSAATNTSVYVVPADTFAVVTVNITNRGASAATVRIALSDSGTPNNADFIEYDTSIPAKGVLERTGIVVQAAKAIVVRSSAIDVTAVVMGIETSTA